MNIRACDSVEEQIDITVESTYAEDMGAYYIIIKYNPLPGSRDILFVNYQKVLAT